MPAFPGTPGPGPYRNGRLARQAAPRLHASAFDFQGPGKQPMRSRDSGVNQAAQTGPFHHALGGLKRLRHNLLFFNTR